jgi:hypothetical protein
MASNTVSHSFHCSGLENVHDLAAHELITLLLLIYFRKETTLEEMAELIDLEDLQVGSFNIHTVLYLMLVGFM